MKRECVSVSGSDVVPTAAAATHSSIVPAAIYTTDANGRINFYNRAAVDM
jgi:PAS domain-containing protein